MAGEWRASGDEDRLEGAPVLPGTPRDDHRRPRSGERLDPVAAARKHKVPISNNGGAFQPLVNTEVFGGANAGIQLSNFFTFFPGFGSTHNDTMNFNIDLSAGTLPSLTPGIYSGTLNIRAQAP